MNAPASIGRGLAAALLSMLLSGSLAMAATSALPRVTRVIKDVAIIERGAAARSVKIGERLGDNCALRTGASSRAEIIFPNQTVARLGAHTLLGIAGAGTNLSLNDGTVLFQSPRGEASTIITGGLSIGTAGATGLIDRHARSYVKVLVLQGTARVYLESKVGESVLVNEGQVLITKPEAKALPEAVDFNIAQLYQTSLLTNRDFAPLASRSLIEQAIAKQKKDPALFPTNLVIYGRGTLVTLSNPADIKAAKQSQKPSPSPAPKKR